MRKIAFSVVVAILVVCSTAFAGVPARFMQFPAIGGDTSKMAFTVLSTHAGALVVGQPIFLTALTPEGWLLFSAEL